MSALPPDTERPTPPSRTNPPSHDGNQSSRTSQDNGPNPLLVEGVARAMVAGDKVRPYRGTLLIAAIILAVLLAVGIIPRLRRSRELAEEARQAANTLPTVNVAPVGKSPTSVALTLPGNIQAIQETQLNARTGGYIQKYFVDVGDRVQAGQVLAQIDIPEVDQEAQQAGAELARSRAQVVQAQAQVAQQSAALQTARANASRAVADVARVGQTAEQQRAQLRQARANAELARVTWQRWQSLVEGGAISRQEADEKHAAYNSSLAQVSSLEAALRAGNADTQAYREAVKAAQADVAAAGQNVSAYRAAVQAAQAGVSAALSNIQRFNVLTGFRQIRAPFAGVITARNVDEGALISSAGAPSSPGSGDSNSPNGTQTASSLFSLARINQVRVFVNVPQTDVPSIRAGQMATVQVRELPKRTFRGQVVRTTSSLDSTARTLRAEVYLPNPQGTLLPGMYAQVKLDVPRANPPLLVPSGALVTDGNGTRVAIVRGDEKKGYTLHYEKVEVARDFGESLEITSGLELNMRVVTNPTNDMKEGDHVTVVSKPITSDQSGGGGQGGSKPSGAGSQGASGQGAGGAEDGKAQDGSAQSAGSQERGQGQGQKGGAQGGQGQADPNKTTYKNARQQSREQGGESLKTPTAPAPKGQSKS